MPTYVYACTSCNNTFEVEQRITENPLDVCDCGSNGTVKRLIQPIAVMFKGSGFHINDYSDRSAVTRAESNAVSSETGECSGQPSSCQRCATDS